MRYCGFFVRKAVLAIMYALALSLMGCAGLSASKVPVGGVEIPFAAHKAGAMVETDLYIKEDRDYTFELMLWFKNMKDTDYIEEFSRTALGGGIPIHLAVEVTGIGEANKTFLYSKKMYAGKKTGHGGPKQRPPGMAGYHNRQIDSIHLKPGLYHVRVTSLDDVPKLAEIPVSFSISYNPKIEAYE